MQKVKYLVLSYIVLVFVGCTVVIVDSNYKENEKKCIGSSMSTFKSSEGNSSSE